MMNRRRQFGNPQDPTVDLAKIDVEVFSLVMLHCHAGVSWRGGCNCGKHAQKGRRFVILPRPLGKQSPKRDCFASLAMTPLPS